jgi:hypothetical protein
MQLASSFRYGSPMLRADSPLSDDQIHRVAPSIFADGKHESRSERYTYIPTIEVLRGPRNEGFQPCAKGMSTSTQLAPALEDRVHDPTRSQDLSDRSRTRYRTTAASLRTPGCSLDDARHAPANNTRKPPVSATFLKK